MSHSVPEEQSLIERLRARRDATLEGLKEENEESLLENKYLDAGTPERAYWHHGYAVALTDVIRLLEKSENSAKH